MKNSDTKFLLFLTLSAILHIVILAACSAFYHKPDNYQNKVEINLNNFELPQEEPVKEDVIEPIEQEQIKLNQIQVPKEPVKIEKIKPERKILREKIVDYSSLAKLTNEVPLNYPTAKRKVHAPVKATPVARHVRGNPKLLSIYLRKIRTIIEENKIYPFSAREKGYQGKVLIEFTLLKNGHISSLKILKSSGHSDLDNAAKRAILDSTPFPRIPDKIKKDSIKVKLYILFKLEEEDEW